MSRTVPGRPRWPILAVLCVAAMALPACSSILSEMPQQVGGLPAGAPERPATPPNYPAVNDMPQARADRPMTDAERKKVQADLDAARTAAAKRAGATAPTQER